MPGETVKRQPVDEDTAIGFYGHITNQIHDEAEQDSEDVDRREGGQGRAPKHTNKDEDRRARKRSRSNS